MISIIKIIKNKLFAPIAGGISLFLSIVAGILLAYQPIAYWNNYVIRPHEYGFRFPIALACWLFGLVISFGNYLLAMLLHTLFEKKEAKDEE